MELGEHSPAGRQIVGVSHEQRAEIPEGFGVIRRPAHGATRRPPFERPGSGFGRPLRAGPPARWRDIELLTTVCAWDPIELLAAAANNGVPAEAAATPVVATTVDDATITI